MEIYSLYKTYQHFCVTFVVHPSVHAALKRVEVEECVRWMVPFAMALREVGGSSMKTFPGIAADDMHNIQTHAAYITWLVSSRVVTYDASRFLGFKSRKNV